MTDDAPTPAEQRVMALLLLLESDAPHAGDGFEERVLRTARWQYAVRGTLRAVADLSAALGQFAMLVGGARR